MNVQQQWNQDVARHLGEKYDFVNKSEVVVSAINHPSLERGIGRSTRHSLCNHDRAGPSVLEQWLPRCDTILFVRRGAGRILESTVTPKGLILQAPSESPPSSSSFSSSSHKHLSQGHGEIWRETDEFSLLLHLIVPSASIGHQILFLMTCLGLPAGKLAFSSPNLSSWLASGRERERQKVNSVFFYTV